MLRMSSCLAGRGPNPESYGGRYPLRLGSALAIMLVYSILLDYDVTGLRTGAVNEKGEQRPSHSTPRGGMPWRPPYATKRLSSYSSAEATTASTPLSHTPTTSTTISALPSTLLLRKSYPSLMPLASTPAWGPSNACGMRGKSPL